MVLMAGYPQSGITHRGTSENDRNRGLLFGNQHVPTSTVRPNSNNMASLTEREMMEQTNGKMVDGLTGRVGQMRDIAIDIGEEVKTQNEFLSGMGSNFENVADTLKETMRRLKKMTETSSGGHMLILALFAFMFFLLVWFLFPR